MRVLDLYAGLEGWSNPFRERGHEIFRVELNEEFPAEFRDTLGFDPLRDMPWRPDIVLASPPCTGFTVMQIGRNWTHRNAVPKTDTARMGIRLLERTLWIIEQADPAFWILENPRAFMRNMRCLDKHERRTVTYCQYGEFRQKPTDLWGHFPPSLKLKAPCKPGAPCHEAAPRGSRTGTQAMESADSAKIPEALSLAVCLAAESDLAAGRTWMDTVPASPHQQPLF